MEDSTLLFGIALGIIITLAIQYITMKLIKEKLMGRRD
jgi:hypothetical protein